MPERTSAAAPVRPWPLLVLIGGYAGLYFFLCWQRWQSFHAQIDLSYYGRLCWGLMHGRHDLPLVQATHILGLHLEPVLLPLVLLGRLGVPLLPLLLFVQALAVALLAWPAWNLAQRHLGPRAGFWGALGALLYPTVTVATLHDFHPVTLALAPLLGFVDALDQGRLRRALLCGGLALLCREDVALQLALGLVAYVLPGRGGLQPAPGRGAAKLRLGGGLLAALLVAYFLTYIVVVQPRYLPHFGSYGLHFAGIPGAQGEAVHSGRDMLLTVLRHPLALLGLLATAERAGYVVQLLWPVGFVALLAPRALAGALPILAINFLSGFPGVRTIESHYTTAMVPFLIGAALIGGGRLRTFLSRKWSAQDPRLGERLGLGIAGGLVGLLTCAQVYHGGSPLAVRSTRFSWSLFHDPPDAAALRTAIAQVPPQASVAARPGPLAHLCERPRAISPPEYDDGQPVNVVLTPMQPHRTIATSAAPR